MKNKLINGLLKMAIIMAALLPIVVQAQQTICNKGAPVKLADQSWESASFTTHVIEQLLRYAYGCTTEIVPGATAAIESALTQDDIQIIAELWTGRSPIMEQAVQAGTVLVVGDTLAGGAEQGWYIPDYVVNGDATRGIKAQAPDLRSWQDLPKYSELFSDPEDPGKGRFLNCPSGWVCELTNSRLLTLHGLDQHYTNFRAGTGAALDSAISSAYERGKPILFYYWQPAGLMAKYRFHKIDMGPFVPDCWKTIVSGEGKLCVSDFLVAHLSVGVSAPFAAANPEIVTFFERLQFTPALLNGMILRMSQERLSATDLAQQFLREQPQVWTNWLPEQAAFKARVSLGLEVQSTVSTQSTIFPDWSAATYVNQTLVGLVKSYGDSFRIVSDALLTHVLLPTERGMQAIPAWGVLMLVGLLAWHATRRITAAFLSVAGLYIIGAVGLWDKLIQTFSLVLLSTVFSVLIGVPLGIIAARSRWVRRLVTPILDVMQTMPSFVYLIPVLMLFGLGKVPALFATVIYALPPLIRLTQLGLRQVDLTVTEAAQSFGVTPMQMLIRVTLPLARPSIMAGINQTTMMALAMVVVASMIGAPGLGEDVLAGIQTLDVGRGLQAGIAIVILAIVIDRITQAYGLPRRMRNAKHPKGYQ
ncbi:ABC transporter permease subunit [Alcaligenaceae bacterium]|nr:ABC transporter permease subunit [Alcaligenaceae bacterium]